MGKLTQTELGGLVPPSQRPLSITGPGNYPHQQYCRSAARLPSSPGDGGDSLDSSDGGGAADLSILSAFSGGLQLQTL